MSTTKATKNNNADNKKEPYVDPALPEDLPEHLKDFDKVFHKSMKNIAALYEKYQKESSDETPIPEDHYSLFVEWALHYTEYCESGLQSGENFLEKELNHKNCEKASSREHFFRSCFPDFLNRTWPIRFNRKFLKKFGSSINDTNKEDIQRSILYRISQYTKGVLYAPVVDVQGLSYMTFFKEKLTTHSGTLVFCVHVERIPEFSSQNKVKAWKYVHVLRFLDLLQETEKVTAVNTCLNFLDDCKKDPARQECQPKLKDRKEKHIRYSNNDTDDMFDVVKCFHGEAIFLSQSFKLMQEDKEKHGRSFSPMVFELDYLTPEEVEDLIYYKDITRWVSKKAYSLFLRKQEESVVSKMNAEIISKFADFESSGRLVELLEKMKNLKIKLTSEEKKLIGQDGNVLAIGRSGTGKTTCSVLRLFSQDMLYKLRLAQSKVQQGMLRDTRNMSDQLDNMIGIHSVFVTASPVLTNEVSRYYQNLSKRIKKELKKKEKPTTKEEIPSEIVSEKAPETEKVAAEEDEEEAETFNEEDYLMDDEEAEMLAKLNKNYSLENIEDKEFPLFLTVKRLVLMIDGCLQQPFFARKKDNTIIGSDTHAQWHNELKGLMMISDKFRGENANEDDDEPSLGSKKAAAEDNLIKEEDEEEDEEEEDDGHEATKINQADIEKEYERYQAILKKRKEQMEEEGRLRKKNKMSFEVDYDYFANHFWNGYLSRQDRPADLSPIIVWSEITSTIKGAADSHLCPGFYLSREVYTALQKEGSTFLNQKNRTKVYDLFVTYEEWKEKEGAYDFMDIVNHALNEVRLRGYNGSPIHFTMIDEVQDLSHATILLLTKITEQSVFFAGDTAQTIAKGVGVRFSDLSSVFKHAPEKEQMWKRPVVHQLTVNFRSHGKILDIANSVVSLMETYFPKTIDKLKKEKSEVDGPKPIILEDVNMEVLFAVLFGTENFKSHRHSQNQASGALEKPPIEFGCNQAIIVRDQESKNKLPPLLKHALCLTVYEAKGLEFDDVILYNFFSESPLTAKEWELLSLLEVEEKKVDKETFERYYFTYKEEKSLGDLKTEQQQDQMDFGRKEEKNGELDLEAPNLFGMQLDQATNQYSLKKVGLAKRVYEVYDYFENYGMVCNEFKQLYVALTRPRNRIVIYDDNIVKRQPMEKYWKNLNLVQIINKDTLESANAAAESTSANKDLESFKSLIASTSEEEWKKQGLKMFRNKYYEQAVKCFERSKDEQLRKRAEAYMLAEKASDSIRNVKSEQNLILKDLGQIKEKDMKEKRVRAKQLRNEERGCFADYEKAANIFVELGLLKQAAQCYFSAELFEKALEIYEKLEMFREAGEACFMLRQYERTAALFLKGGDFVRAVECYEQSRDYNKILEILENLKDLPSEQRKYYAQRYVPLALKGLAEELENKTSTPVLPKESIVKEAEDSEGEEEEIKDKKEAVSEMSFEVIDKSKKSVSDLSFENVEAEDLDNYEHLSQYDVIHDEFLKSESGSVIESLASLRKEKSLTSSEFSAIDYNYLMDNHYQLVKTKADIFVQDAMMEKIIKYVDMFSQDFRESLQNLRSKDVLLTEAAHNKASVPTISNNLIDLDHISLDFVYFALDFLEQHKLFKLCIFVCNRYSLANKLGRYLVNMAFKYSNFPYDDIRASFIKIIQHRSRQIQQEKAFVANLALHNVLEIVNPKYLKLKKKGEIVDETNSLGDDCFSQLISLGFWKKCLFLMDYNNSLGLASTFASFNNYKLIYLTGSDAYSFSKEEIKKSVESEGFGFLPFEIPSNYGETQAAIITLESVIWDLSEKFPSHLYKHYKPVVSSGGIKVPQFPLYFVCNEALWNFIVNKNREKLAEVLEGATIELEAILNSKEVNPIMQARLFDIVSFMVQIIEFYNTNNLLSEFINKLDVRIATKYITALAKIVEQILDGPCLNKSEEIIIKAILSPFRIRYIERTSVLKKIGLHNYLAHISSPIMSDIIVSDGSHTGAFIYDIEANFVLVPTDLCLKGIRKRIADIMRHIIRHQVKAYPSYDEGTRMVHVLDDVNEYLGDKARLLRAISNYEYCQAYVQGIRSSPVKKAKLDTPGKKKKKQVDEVEANDYEQMEEDERFDNMLGDYGHHKVDLKSRLDKVAKPKEKQAVQQKSGGKQHKEKGEGESMGSLKADILREIKFIFSNFVNISLELDYYARTELLDFALQKLSQYLYQNKTKVWVVHLLVAIGHRVTLNEVLRKNKKNATAQNLQLYSDAIYYKQFFCSEDYTNNVFDFLFAAEDLSNKELLAVIEDLVGYVIAADSVKQKDSQICLSASLLHGLGVPAISKTEKLQINIGPLNLTDLLGDILNWVATAAEKLTRNKIGPQFCRILVLIQNLIANVSDLDNNSFNALYKALEYLLDNKACNFKLKEVETKNNANRKREDLNKTEASFLENLEVNLESLEILSEEELEQFSASFIKEDLMVLTVESDAKIAKKNYDRSEAAFLKDESKIAQRINLQRKLKKLFAKKGLKLREKLLFNACKTGYPLELVENNTKRDILKLIASADANLGTLFGSVDAEVRRVLNFYASSAIYNTIDFHYIWNLSQKLIGYGVEFVESMNECLNNKRKVGELKELYKEKLNKIQETMQQYESWRENQTAKAEDKGSKKQKFTRVKWEEEALVAKMQQIAKKRKGLKKQALQQEKKAKNRFFNL